MAPASPPVLDAEEIVGSSPAMRAVLERVAKVASADSTVLITGETGTGKELVARAIHNRSRRAPRPFIAFNCAGIPPTLVASELFGHEKGAFTGAQQRRLGRFEIAAGGTIFLDEVGELPGETQIALLRVLQEREFERVGAAEPIHIDVRVIAATNCDLQDAVTAGKFRLDLFYRLNVFPIEMPALRERRQDIPALLQLFVRRYSDKAGKRFSGVEKRTMELFESYHWPGNIRELQNVIERSVLVCDGELFSVDTSWLSRAKVQPVLSSTVLPERLLGEEKRLIESALAQSHGKVSGPTGAAVKLGLPPSTLESKIKTLKIRKAAFKAN
ncbi:MAG TPA: sigma-54 dependent transcriptional regulator [Candidatus Binatia bacterium]|nr:sigma-54 dependent transcriptional regulator [Candidatus Binatia bacterium]